MLCPACNALVSLSPACPACGSAATDEGKADDWSGPYSPYSPTMPSASSTGFITKAGEACVHLASCPDCGRTFSHAVAQWGDPDA